MEFLESMRKGAARAQLETEKLLRINRVQREINALKQRIRQRTLQLGEKSLELYRAEELSESALIAICEGIVTLEKEIAEKEVEIEAIRLESLPEEIVAAPATYGHLCPQCKISLPEEAVFCPNCGSKAVDVPPPAGPSMAAQCTNCGAMLLEDAVFCPQCGTKVERKPEAVEPSGAVCSECGSPLKEDAVFCPNCGTKVPEAQAQAPKPEDVTVPEEE